MGRGPLRLRSEPHYNGGDPNVVDEVNPGVEENQFDLWRNLRVLYTRIEIALEQHEVMDHLLFTRLQVRWEQMSRVCKIARIICHTLAHECKSRYEICRDYRLSTDLLL